LLYTPSLILLYAHILTDITTHHRRAVLTLIIEPITDIISLIAGKNRGRFPWSNSFLIQGSETVLIDTGCGIENLQALKQQYSIDYVINSHCHPDHSAGNWVFAGLPLHAPLESADSHGRMEPLSRRLAKPGKLAEIWKKFVVEEMNFQDSFPTRFYQDGDEFDLGDTRLRAVHTPGHTADHYCFFEPEERILFSFDLDLTPFGPWYGHRESDLSQLRRSIRIMRQLNPKVVVSSHREILTEGIHEEIDRFEAVLTKREHQLISLLENGATFSDILATAPFYGSRPYQPELLTYWEGQMIQKHLDEIKEKGLIKESYLLK